MKSRKLIAYWVVIVSVAVSPAIVWACMGTPQPPRCPQSAWVAKFVSTTVVNNNATGSTTIPIGIIPYVTWDNGTGACAQPISASLTVRLECTPLGGGGVVGLPTIAVPVDTPTTPGAQPVNGSIGGIANYTISQGALGAGNFVCTVIAEYDVSFGTGRGSGVLTGTGDAEVCIVEPSPSDPNLPRLGLTRLDLGDGGFLQCATGDQGLSWYLLSNNDPTNSVTVDFESSNTQIAVMPTHSMQDPNSPTPDQTIFAISNPLSPDPFFQSLVGDLTDGLIPDGDPLAAGAGVAMQSDITLDPFDIEIIGVATRPFGMCADGSCSEISTKIEGIWNDGSMTPAVACAGTVAFVDNSMPFKSPLCLLDDTICVDPNSFVNAGAALFNGDTHFSTHASGNNVLSPGVTNVSGMTAIEISSGGDPNSPLNDHPQMSHSILRMVNSPEFIYYGPQFSGCFINGNPAQFQQHQTQCNILNLPDGPFDITIPLITQSFDPMTPSSSFTSQNIVYDAQTDQLRLWDFSQNPDVDDPLLDESLANLMKGNVPTGFTVYPETYRRFTKTPPETTGGLLEVEPSAVARLLNKNEPATSSTFDALVDQVLADWTASLSSTTAASLTSASGSAGTKIELNIDPLNVAESPDTTLLTMTVDSPGASNTVKVPIALRTFDGPTPPGIQPGEDFISTSGCGGQSFADFSKNPLPADFFGPGSLPFDGEIHLGGSTLNGGSFGTSDTVLRRLSEANVALVGASDTVPIELVALSLQSCDPITVQVNGQSTMWDVEVDLDVSGQLPQGDMTIMRTSALGGTFSAMINTQPRFTFTEVGNISNTITFTGLEKGTGILNLVITDAPWADTCDDPNLFVPTGMVTLPNGVMAESSGDFFPFVIDTGADMGQSCLCVQRLAMDGSTFQLGFSPPRITSTGDSDGDGVDDDCDGCPDDVDPLQEDSDNDGIGDACDNCPDTPNSDQADRNMDGEGDECDDEDGDTLTDAEEAAAGTNPDVFDTDGDGNSDGWEVDNNSNPNDENDVPDFMPGDLNGDGGGNAADLQSVINRALALVVQFSTDLNDDGNTNSVDIQLYINYLLGIGTLP